MCGLVGFFGSGSANTDKTFLDLLQVNTIRGAHSTGVAIISDQNNKKNNPNLIYKDVGPPENLFDFTSFKTDISRKGNTALIGHGRWATTGDINQSNAHPFWHGNIIGAHNGTIRSQLLIEDKESFDTDSESIIESISRVGIEETYKLINGAAAMVWWNEQDRSINLIRNSERPLCFALTKDGNGMFWASENWMLAGCAQRNKIVLDKILYPKPHWHFKFTRALPKLPVIIKGTRLTPFVWINHDVSTHYGGINYRSNPVWEGWKGWRGQEKKPDRQQVYTTSLPSGDLTKPKSSETKTLSRKEKKVLRKRVQALETRKEMLCFSGARLQEKEFSNKYEFCLYCEDPLEFGDLYLHFLSTTEAICDTCKSIVDEQGMNINAAVIG